MASENMNPAEEKIDPFDVSSDVGISEEDKQDVIRRIDKIASENKIALSDEQFNLGGIKAGSLFPLLVNILAVVFLVGTVIVLSIVFTGNERTMVRESVEYTSIEGQLIRELRRESQNRISEKDREILEIERRIEELELEREALIESIETRVEQRRLEYNQIILDEVADERSRLESQGISRQEIDRLLAAYEAELRAYYDSELQNYRETIEEERVEIEANLDRLRSDYLEQIENLQRERQELLSDFRVQETNLRSQLEQRTRVLEESRTAAVEDLEAARVELAQLEVQKQQTESIENQVLGYFNRIEGAISRSAWDEALSIINTAVQYLNQDTVLVSNVVSARRPVDLFVLSSLRSYVESERSDREEFANVSRQLEILSRINLNAVRAESALQNNQNEDAIQFYSNIMGLMPQLDIAHSALVENRIEEYNSDLQGELEDRINRINGLLSQAAVSVASGNYEAALSTYDEAIAISPDMAGLNGDVNAALMRLGYSLADIVVFNLDAGRYQGMLDRADVIPQQTITSINSHIAQAVENREDTLFAELAEADSEISVLTATYEERLAEQTSNSAELSSEVDRLESELEVITDQRDDLLSEISRLETFEQLLGEVEQQYRDYQRREQAILAEGSESELQTVIAARQELESFIGSPELSGIFPGFASRYRSSDNLLIEAGRDEGMNIALEILDGVFGQASADQQNLYIENELAVARSQGDQLLEEFLSELSALVVQ